MTTYTIEEIRRLNGCLLEIQREHLCNTTTTAVISDTSLTPQQAWEDNDKTQFLLAANQALDGLLSKTDQLADINKYLTWYASFQQDSDYQLNDSVLDWLFVTKCTLAVYGCSLSSILQSTLPLSESLAYWDSIYGNPWYEAYYGLQSAPIRLYSLAQNTRRVLLDTSFNKTASAPFGVRALLTSSDHILSSLFPMAIRNERNEPRHTHRHRPGKALVQVFRKLYNAPLPVALIHDEIQQKRMALRSFRTYQATTLGLLIKQAPRFDDASLPDGELQTVSLTHVARGTSQCVMALTSCLLDPASGISPLMHRQDSDFQSTLDDLEASSKEFSMTSTSPYKVAYDLKKVVEQQPTSEQYLALWNQDYGPPSRLTRYWIPGILALLGGKMALDYVFERKEDIVAWAKDGLHTMQEFFVHWLWEPSVKVLDTIRFKDQRIGLSSKEGLKSDLDSLERMVVEFAKDQAHLTDSEVARLITQVRDGDVSVVLRAYENEIKNPLRNAIQGDLIQALLIQVQKTKVDVDMAMQALDKLLKSNELNFAFLAVAPSMLLTYASFSWLKNIYQRRSGNRIRQLGQPLKDTLRRIERLFTLNESNELTCESQGVLLCELLLLRNYAQSLPTQNSIREMFIEDIGDLETVRLDKQQKKETVLRMYHSWRFLS